MGRGGVHRQSLRGKPRRWRVLLAVLVVTSLLVLGSWAGTRGAQARDHLLSAAGLARDLYDQLETGRSGQARQTLTALQAQTRAARHQTGGRVWRTGRRLPLVGGNLAAVADIAVALDDLAHDGLPPLVDAASDLDPAKLVLRSGRIELAPLQRAAPGVTVAHLAITRARDRVAAIRTERLLPDVRSAVAQVRRELDRAAASIGTAFRAAVLAPPMLGADGRRTYLVLFQNNAELRATGGIPGAFAIIEADKGVLRMVRQGTAATDLSSFHQPVLPLDPAMRHLYTDRLTTFPADVNLTPHFPTAAAIAREMYRQRSGDEVDGVIAIDPVALSYLLRATGPVPDGHRMSLTADNVVRMLLSDVYAQYESNAEQDAYFADVAAAVFDSLNGDGTDVSAAIRELARAAGERRLLMWSVRPDEQRLLADTVLGGELPADDGDRPVVGVFLNDGTGAKLGYYLTPSVRLSGGACRPDGRQEMRLRVTLGSSAPRAGLSPLVLGLRLAGDPYTIRTNVLVASPAGGSVVDARLDGDPAPLGTGTERSRVIGVLTVDVPPGASRTIDVTVLTGVPPHEGHSRASLWLTPTATPWLVDGVSYRSCR